MATLESQVRAAGDAIDTNIAMNTSDRGFLSKNVLQYLRDLVAAMVVWAHTGDPALQFNYTKRILTRMVVSENVKDEALLGARRGIVPVTPRPRLNHVRPTP